jgi:tripartite-type tricarboxylate transporter receptor subunit TctC
MATAPAPYRLLSAATSAVARLREEMAKIATMPDTRDRLRNIGFEASVGTGEAFTALVQKELHKWDKVVKETGAKVE